MLSKSAVEGVTSADGGTTSADSSTTFLVDRTTSAVNETTSAASEMRPAVGKFPKWQEVLLASFRNVNLLFITNASNFFTEISEVGVTEFIAEVLEDVNEVKARELCYCLCDCSQNKTLFHLLMILRCLIRKKL